MKVFLIILIAFYCSFAHALFEGISVDQFRCSNGRTYSVLRKTEFGRNWAFQKVLKWEVIGFCRRNTLTKRHYRNMDHEDVTQCNSQQYRDTNFCKPQFESLNDSSGSRSPNSLHYGQVMPQIINYQPPKEEVTNNSSPLE